MKSSHSAAKYLFVGVLSTAAIAASGPLIAQSLAPKAAPAQTAVSIDNPLQLTPHHVTISVADIEKEQAWYTQVLGFKETGRGGKAGDDFLHRNLSIIGYRIDLSWQKGSIRHTVGTPSDLEQGWRHIVFTTPDVEKTLLLLREKNVAVRVDRNQKTNAISQLFITDPEGNEIELQPG